MSIDMPGFIDIFTKNVRKKDNVFEINIKDLRNWIDIKTTEQFKEFYSSSSKEIDEIKKDCTSVLEAAKSFLSFEVKVGELDETLLKTVRTSRDAVANKMISTLSKLEYPKSNDFENIRSFNIMISQTLTQIDNTLRTHGRVIFTILSKDTRQLVTKLKTLQAEIKNLNKILENYNRKYNNTQQIHSETTYIFDLYSEIQKLENLVENIKNEILESEKKENETVKKMKHIENQREYAEALEISNKIKELDKSLEKEKTDLDTMFSSIKKPLERYHYVASLGKDENNVLKCYLDSPSSGIVNDQKLLILNILEELKKKLTDGKLVLKNTEKVINNIDNLTGTLKETQNLINEISKKIRSKTDIIEKSSIKEFEKLSIELHEKHKEKKDQNLLLEKNALDLKEKTEYLKVRLSKMESNIKEMLDESIKIKISNSS